jgi:hypothetical protein
MKSELLTIFGVVAIAALVATGLANANEAPTIDSASADEVVESAAALPPTESDLQLEEAAANATGEEDTLATPEAETAATQEASPAPLEAESTHPGPARFEEGGEKAEQQATLDSSPSENTPLPTSLPAPGIKLGEVGYDEQGRSGRIHLVVSGDTLWDISDAYLGTPWVWPSVWTDNRDIENPHLIVPGDRIWISAYEMRRVSEEEAQQLLAGRPEEEVAQPAAAAAPEPEMAAPADPLPTIIRVSSRESTGLISTEQLESSASIVDTVPSRVMISQGDQVYVGLGEGEASVGDQFSVLRVREKVFDPDTGRLLGYHVDMLGWLEVDEPSADTSLATVRLSASEMEVGDRIIPREIPDLDIEVGSSPHGVDGRISFFPSSRVLMGSIDYVYLNRGEIDGLVVGNQLEVYRRGWAAPERARGTRVEVPDRVIAQLLVVRAQPETAVALITHTETELELGDHFRGAGE